MNTPRTLPRRIAVRVGPDGTPMVLLEYDDNGRRRRAWIADDAPAEIRAADRARYGRVLRVEGSVGAAPDVLNQNSSQPRPRRRVLSPAARQARVNAYRRERYARQREQILAYKRAWWANMPPEQRERRLATMRAYGAGRRRGKQD